MFFGRAAVALATVLSLGSCTTTADAPSAQPAPTQESSPAGSASPSNSPDPTPAPVPVEETTPALPASAGKPMMATLSIPALAIKGLRVAPYVGWTDDGPGTVIQDRGIAASPHGPRGGVGPGGIGNYQVTAHRLSSTRAFEFLPDLRRGDRVVVQTRTTTYSLSDHDQPRDVVSLQSFTEGPTSSRPGTPRGARPPSR